MALESDNIYKKYWGYHKIMEFYKNDANAKILYEKYNFTFKDYLQLAKKCDTGDIFIKKYRKYKKISNFFNNSMFLSNIIYYNYNDLLIWS
ncbi:hypothetical protein OLU52_03515 [Campylobacter jejuni]|nr:hypothetical protein [Campylobacter jejuni]